MGQLDTKLSAAQSDVLKERVTERLKEMDLLVDDELADYVVVLVGNGKGEDEIAQVCAKLARERVRLPTPCHASTLVHWLHF